MISSYKSKFRNSNTNKLSIYQLISNCMEDGFENEDQENENINELWPEDTFYQNLKDIMFLILNEDIYQLCLAFSRLSHQFTIKSNEQIHRIEIFRKSELLSNIIEDCDFPPFSDTSPFILQLLSNIIACESESDNFVSTLCDYNIVEKIDHLRSTLSSKYIPLLCVFAYNIYSVKNNKKIDLENELFYIFNFKIFDSSENNFFIPFQAMNLFRWNKIKFKEIDHFKDYFNILIAICQTNNFYIAEYGMWCIYFYFKNSHKYAEPFIKKKLLSLLQRCIEEGNEIFVKIALYVFSFCYMVESTEKQYLCMKYTPIDKILSLIQNDEQEIASLALALCNNIISYNNSYALYLLEKGTFPIILYIAQNGSTICKIEAGFLITTILLSSGSDIVENILTEELLYTICDLFQINDLDLSNSLIQTLFGLLPIYPSIADFLQSINFDKELESIFYNNTSIISDPLMRLIQIIQYRKSQST